MYDWFFLLWGLSVVSGMLDRYGSPGLSAIIFVVPAILFAIFSNSLYHRKITKKIEKAKKEIDDESKILEYLEYKGGVNTWVIWVCVAIPVLGILASILLPLFAGK